jgi:hypothetical protein
MPVLLLPAMAAPVAAIMLIRPVTRVAAEVRAVRRSADALRTLQPLVDEVRGEVDALRGGLTQTAGNVRRVREQRRDRR